MCLCTHTRNLHTYIQSTHTVTHIYTHSTHLHTYIKHIQSHIQHTLAPTHTYTKHIQSHTHAHTHTLAHTHYSWSITEVVEKGCKNQKQWLSGRKWNLLEDHNLIVSVTAYTRPSQARMPTWISWTLWSSASRKKSYWQLMTLRGESFNFLQRYDLWAITHVPIVVLHPYTYRQQ